MDRFHWQEGLGAFSYSHLGDVISYIQKQEEHHGKNSFKSEHLGLLRKFDIAFSLR
jgi:putative transposase